MTGQLMEVEKHEMSGDVACLDIAPVPEGRQRSRFLAVGSYDNIIRILSLDPDDCMQILSVQSVSSTPESLLFLEVQASIEGSETLFNKCEGSPCNAMFIESTLAGLYSPRAFPANTTII
ncbi:Spliceosome-associated protein 130 B [Linum perenne]